MTPQLIHARILKAQQAELRRVVDELQAYPPVNCAELLTACREIQDEITAQSRRLHDDRRAVSAR